jgi:hypothetical protein
MRMHLFQGFFGSEGGREIRFSKEKKHNFRRVFIIKICHITERSCVATS